MKTYGRFRVDYDHCHLFNVHDFARMQYPDAVETSVNEPPYSVSLLWLEPPFAYMMEQTNS